MGLFRRSSGRGRDPEPADEEFGFLDRHQAARVRELAQQAFAELGVETVIQADHLAGADGTKYGLANLMAACHAEDGGERRWPDVVRRHADSIITALADRRDPADLPVQEMLSRVYLRLVGTATLPPDWATDGYGYGRPVGGDLVELLCLDSPQSVRTLRQEAVDAFGADELRRAGLENLLHEPIDSVEEIDCGDGATAAVVTGDSVYTASRVLALPDLLRRVYGEREYPGGVVLAVPFRHQVVLHPVDSAAALVAITRLAPVAHAGFAEGVGSVSPHLFWWWQGELRQLTFPDEDGGIVVHADDDLTAVLNGFLE